jgi:hypothetical protein
MASITLNSVGLSTTPGVNQTVTVRYRLTSDPDVIGSYTLVTATAVVLPNGNFSSPVVISSLLNDTSYTVWVQNNCAGTGFKKSFTTPLPICVDITDITGTTAP